MIGRGIRDGTARRTLVSASRSVGFSSPLTRVRAFAYLCLNLQQNNEYIKKNVNHKNVTSMTTRYDETGSKGWLLVVADSCSCV